MSVSGVVDRTGADYQQYQKPGEDILFKTYSYQNGKGQETVYYAKDCVELSLDSYKIPIGSDNYEDIKNMLTARSHGNIASMGSGMFHETSEVMQACMNFLAGQIQGMHVRRIWRKGNNY